MCELCAKRSAPVHQHLLELEKRRVTCACEACAILFGGNARQRYRRIPRDVAQLRDFVMDDQEWDSLLIPINLAFFVHNSAAGRVVAQYPSPGGAMESSLDLEYWDAIVERNPVLQAVGARCRGAAGEPHLRVRRSTTARPSISASGWSGIIRTHWRGLSGGTEVWREIERFFRRT